MKCSSCQKELAPESRVAAITGSILGDETCDVFYLCPSCDSYTVLICRDDFDGAESTDTRGPISRAEGDESVALIRTCSTPWDKTCRCNAHATYFCGALD